MEQIANVTLIRNLLLKLQKQRAMLTVSFPSHAEKFMSWLVDIPANKPSLYIDELRPESGQLLMRLNQPLQIETQLQGIKVDFSSQMQRQGIKNGTLYYEITLPSSMNYHQHRNAYRAKPRKSNAITVHLTPNAGQGVSGDLNDISLGGINIQLNHPQAQLSPGDQLHCRFRLPGGDNIHCQVEIRHFKPSPKTYKQVNVGARFTSLPTLQQRAIGQFVTMLQREELKIIER